MSWEWWSDSWEWWSDSCDCSLPPGCVRIDWLPEAAGIKHSNIVTKERRALSGDPGSVLTVLLACCVVQAGSISVTTCPCPAASFSGLCRACRLWVQTELVLVWAWLHFHSLQVSGDRERTWVFRTICSADVGCKWKFEGGRFTFSKEIRLKSLRLVLVHRASNEVCRWHLQKGYH